MEGRVMKSRSTCLSVATIGIISAITPAASAATIVNPILGGPFSAANPLGTIQAIDLSQANTYDFTFSLFPDAGDVLTQVQASVMGPDSEPIQFGLYAGAPGSGALIATSNLMFGPSLTEMLNVGNYYIQIDYTAANGELLGGGLQVAAVPEPAAWAMILLGVGGLGATLRRFRRGSAVVTV
jgi:hypothetical protein